MERTLSIIKPDAFKKGLAGKIIDKIIEAGFNVKAMKMLHLSKAEAQGFYAVHKDKPFYDELTDFMSSGPCIVMVLAADDVISRYRKLMGATNPANADPGTIRHAWGDNVQNNAVHGSDAPETAMAEIAYFFNALEIVG